MTRAPVRLAQPKVRWGVAARHIRAALGTGWLTNGPKVATFEKMVAKAAGTDVAVATSSGTAAIHLALLAHGLGPGREVIVADYTFPATVNAIVHCGATPVLADVRPDTYNLDPDQVEGLITSRTKAILPVHQFGLCADMSPLRALAKKTGLALVEDAACALGAQYAGRPAGSLGDSACFSFHPRKVVTTGEGGAVVANDPQVTDAVRLWRNHGMVTEGGKRTFHAPAYNYRLDELSASIGIEQMGQLKTFLRRRRALARRYGARLRRLGDVRPPVEPDGTRHSYQSYSPVLKDDIDRDRVIQRMNEAGIEATRGAEAVHALPYMQSILRERKSTLPVSAKLAEHAIILPLHPSMSYADVDRVVLVLEESLR